MESHEVIVVGAGPAGASCAKALRENGRDVLLLEKDDLPRYKTCSGVLFGQTQELIAEYFKTAIPDEVFCRSTRTIVAGNIREWNASTGYERYVWELDKDGKSFATSYHNVWRNLFDKWLLDQSGAAWRDGLRVTRLENDDGQVRVQAQSVDGNETTDYRCKYLIGADGGASTVRRILSKGRPAAADPVFVVVMQSYFKLESRGTLKKDGWTVFFLPEIGDVLCCVHQKDDYLVLHVGGFRGRKLRESMEMFKAFLTDKFEVRLGPWWRDEGCQMELAPPLLGEGRVLLTGEAGGFMYLNGEGIAAAIDSGYRCGKAVVKALDGKGDALTLYADSTRDVLAHVQKCIDNLRFFA